MKLSNNEDLVTCSSSPINSTVVDESSSEDEIDKDIVYLSSRNLLNIEILPNIGCATMCSVNEVKIGGNGTSFELTGVKSNIAIGLKNLSPISLTDARYFSAVYLRSMTLSTFSEKSFLLLRCLPIQPAVIENMVIYPENLFNNEKLVIHIIQISANPPPAHKKKFLDSFRTKETNFFAMYDILGDLKFESNSLSEEFNTSVVNDETSLQIMLYWSGSGYHVSKPPPHSAKAVIKLQVVAGETRSAAHDAYIELKALDTVVNRTDNQSFLNNSISDKALEKLYMFKDSVSDFSYYGNGDVGTANEKTDDLETPMTQFLHQAFQRNDHDFTDKLWLFLFKLENRDEMRQCIKEVLQDIINGALQPAISPANETKLAKFIRQMYLADSDESKLYAKDKLFEFLSSETAVYNLIIEIGIEKLRKDYFNFFLSKELTTLYNLQKLCKATAGNVDIACLWKLHLCLEAVITPSIYLTLSRDCESLILKAAIEFYCNNDVSFCSPVFFLPLMPFHDASPAIHQACEARHPIIWQCGTINQNKVDLLETMIYHVTNKSLIPDEETENFSVLEDVKVVSEQTMFLPFKQKIPKNDIKFLK